MKTIIINFKDKNGNMAVVVESRNDDGILAFREWLGNKSQHEIDDFIKRRNLTVDAVITKDLYDFLTD